MKRILAFGVLLGCLGCKTTPNNVYTAAKIAEEKAASELAEDEASAAKEKAKLDVEVGLGYGQAETLYIIGKRDHFLKEEQLACEGLAIVETNSPAADREYAYSVMHRMQEFKDFCVAQKEKGNGQKGL